MNRRTIGAAWETILKSPARLTLFIAMWIAAFASIPLHNRFEEPAWDVTIYLQAVDSIRQHHDPYADAIARQTAFHQAQARGETGPTPFSYVYGPITLPALWFVAAVPLWLSAVLYWSMYMAGVFAMLCVTLAVTSEAERPIFIYFLPAAVFFPGFLASDIVWSGNIAFILYGAALAAAMLGWKRHRWALFYAVVLVASCFKAPLLTLLAIPIFTARDQRLRAGLVGLAGVGLFLSQRTMAPQLFHHYLQAVELQFSYNRDFGSSPAGLFSGILFDHGLSYSPAAYLFYAAYAIPLCATLILFSKRFLAGRITLSQWVPLLLIGVILLNPRMMEYDESLLSIPVALVVWRFYRSLAARPAAIVLSIATFAAVNLIAYRGWNVWKLTEGPLLVCSFLAGAWTLFHASIGVQAHRYRAAELATVSESSSHVLR